MNLWRFIKHKLGLALTAEEREMIDRIKHLESEVNAGKLSVTGRGTITRHFTPGEIKQLADESGFTDWAKKYMEEQNK